MYADLENLRQLPLAEKLHVVEVLWEDIAASNEVFPLPEWLRSEAAERLAQYSQDPATAINREELWQRVDEKRG
jgi:putative addiction module component (TIGR02574 family)